MRRNDKNEMKDDGLDSDIGFSLEEMEQYMDGKADSEAAATINLMRMSSPEVDEELRVLQYDPAPAVHIEADPAKYRGAFYRGLSFSGVAATAMFAIFIVRGSSNQITSIDGMQVLTKGGEYYSIDKVDLESIKLASGTTSPSSDKWRSVWAPGQSKSGGDSWVVSETDTTIAGTEYLLKVTPSEYPTSVSIQKDGAPEKTIQKPGQQIAIPLDEPGVYILKLNREQTNGTLDLVEFRLRVMDATERKQYEDRLSKATSDFDRLSIYAEYGFTTLFAQTQSRLKENHKK